MKRMPRRSVAVRLMGLFALLLVAFTLMVGLFYNTLMRRQMISHYSRSMQYDALAIAQNLSEMFAPSVYDVSEENLFIVSEETLAPYLALTERLSDCSVYLVDVRHNVTAYLDGVVQSFANPLLPGYLEQTIALGFMGKTPFIQADLGDDTHLSTAMPVMNAQSRVLGVVVLETSLRELGFTQVPTARVLLISCCIAFAVSVLLASAFSHIFTRPISNVQKAALALADGRYETRICSTAKDELGSLARAMDVLAVELEAAHSRDEKRRKQQQQLFSNISHELRTPVTVIRGSLEALRDGVVNSPEDIRAYYAQMIKESCWLQQLIQNLLELSRLQNDDFTLNMGTVDLCELLGDVAMSARTLCEQKHVRFTCEEPASHFTILGDYSRLRQMLLAVVDNAVKFTPEGKGIRLWLDENAPRLIIQDEGVGMDESEINHIFERFYSGAYPTREGTGLGLAIVQEIARRHGITIEVHSCRGEGTAFSFTFPA